MSMSIVDLPRLTPPAYFDSIRDYWQMNLKSSQGIITRLVQVILLTLGTVFIYGIYQHRQRQWRALIASTITSVVESARNSAVSTPIDALGPASASSLAMETHGSDLNFGPKHHRSASRLQRWARNILAKNRQRQTGLPMSDPLSSRRPPFLLREGLTVPHSAPGALATTAGLSHPLLPRALVESKGLRLVETGRHATREGTIQEYRVDLSMLNSEMELFAPSREIRYQAAEDNLLHCTNNKATYGSLMIQTSSPLGIEIVTHELPNSDADIYVVPIEDRWEKTAVTKKLGVFYQRQIQSLCDLTHRWSELPDEIVVVVPCPVDAASPAPSRVIALIMPEVEKEEGHLTEGYRNSLYRSYFSVLMVADMYTRQALQTIRMPPLSLDRSIAEEEAAIFFGAVKAFLACRPQSGLKIKLCVGIGGDLTPYFHPLGKKR